nr:hypothetical protein [Bacteroidota bacterium]
MRPLHSVASYTMDLTDLASGNTLKAQKEKIDAVQAATATSGALGLVMVRNATGAVLA